MNTSSRHPLAIAGVAAAAVTILATLLPYVTLGPISRSGLDTSDGKATAVLALIGLLSFAFGRGRLWSLILQLVMAVLITLMAIADVFDIRDKGLEVGSGLWLILIAGIAWSVVAIVLLVRRRQIWPASADAPEPPTPLV